MRPRTFVACEPIFDRLVPAGISSAHGCRMLRARSCSGGEIMEYGCWLFDYGRKRSIVIAGRGGSSLKIPPLAVSCS